MPRTATAASGRRRFIAATVSHSRVGVGKGRPAKGAPVSARTRAPVRSALHGQVEHRAGGAGARTAVRGARRRARPSRSSPSRPGFQDETVLEGLQSPTAVRVAPPPDGRIFVAQKDGARDALRRRRRPDPQLVGRPARGDARLLGPRAARDGARPAVRHPPVPVPALHARRGDRRGAAGWNDVCTEVADAGCPASARLVRVRVDALGVAGPVEPRDRGRVVPAVPEPLDRHRAVRPRRDAVRRAPATPRTSARADWGQLPDSGTAPPNPCGDPPTEGGSMRSQDLRTAGDPVGLDGAIVRVDPDTGLRRAGQPVRGLGRRRTRGGSSPTACATRSASRSGPGRNELWIGEVGYLSLGGDRPRRRRDRRHGGELRLAVLRGRGGAAAAFADVPVCAALPASDDDAAGASLPARRELGPRRTAATCAAAPPWRASRSRPPAFPAAYDGALFFGDFAAGCIFAMRAGAGGAPDPATLELFARREEGDGGPVELQAGADGSLYYTLFDSRDPERGSLHRIAYRPDNRCRWRGAAAVPTEGPLPLRGRALGRRLDRPRRRRRCPTRGTSTATARSTTPRASRSRTPTRLAGRSASRCGLTNGNGASDTDAVTVSPGDTSPRPVIEAPAAGLRWTAGDASPSAGRRRTTRTARSARARSTG